MCIYICRVYTSILQNNLKSFPISQQCCLENHVNYWLSLFSFPYCVLPRLKPVSCPTLNLQTVMTVGSRNGCVFAENWECSLSCPAELITQVYWPGKLPLGNFIVVNNRLEVRRKRWFEENEGGQEGNTCIVIFWWITSPCFMFLPVSILLSLPRCIQPLLILFSHQWVMVLMEQLWSCWRIFIKCGAGKGGYKNAQ